MSPLLLRPAPLWAIQLAVVAGGALVFALVWFCLEMTGLVLR